MPDLPSAQSTNPLRIQATDTTSSPSNLPQYEIVDASTVLPVSPQASKEDPKYFEASSTSEIDRITEHRAGPEENYMEYGIAKPKRIKFRGNLIHDSD